MKGNKPGFFKRPRRTKYAALTTDTMYLTRAFPKEARTMLERLIPIFDIVHAEPYGEQRWLSFLQKIPEDILADLPAMRQTKSKQAIHVTVMLAVFARVLYYPHVDNALLCDMADEELHLATNRIIVFYLPFEHFRRLGYLHAEIPPEPFVPWTSCKLFYTEAGLAAGSQLEHFMAPDNSSAEHPVPFNFAEWELV